MTTDAWTEAKQRAQVRVACGRIAGAAAAILEAHRLGTAQGPHEQPWTPSYARDAVLIYAESLPAWYQSDIAALFGHSTTIMAECTIPARLSADWVIVTDYMISARATIVGRYKEPVPVSAETLGRLAVIGVGVIGTLQGAGAGVG